MCRSSLGFRGSKNFVEVIIESERVNFLESMRVSDLSLAPPNDLV